MVSGRKQTTPLRSIKKEEVGKTGVIVLEFMKPEGKTLKYHNNNNNNNLNNNNKKNRNKNT